MSVVIHLIVREVVHPRELLGVVEVHSLVRRVPSCLRDSLGFHGPVGVLTLRERRGMVSRLVGRVRLGKGRGWRHRLHLGVWRGCVVAVWGRRECWVTVWGFVWGRGWGAGIGGDGLAGGGGRSVQAEVGRSTPPLLSYGAAARGWSYLKIIMICSRISCQWFIFWIPNLTTESIKCRIRLKRIWQGKFENRIKSNTGWNGSRHVIW